MRKLTLLLLLCAGYFPLQAQFDPLYNQYQFNQFMINPAYAGIYNRFSGSIISRVQWVGIEGAPSTTTLSAQGALNKGRIGMGVLMIHDQLGVNKNLETQVAASYNIRFGEKKLGMGVQGGLVNYRYDLSKLSLDYVDDERLLTGLDNITTPNFGAGLMLMSPNYYVGLSVPRILDVSVEDGVTESTRYLRHYYLSGGYYWEASTYVHYRVSTLLRYVEGNVASVDLNVSTYLDERIWAGLTSRNLRDFGLFAILELANNMRIGYSFELPTNSLVLSSYGSHEITIAFDAPLEKARYISKRRF